MANTGLLFIPDISGFTHFVANIELRHSQQAIQELLELLIDNNDMDLEISEVEGDAILFFKFGDSFQLSEIYHQVEKMFSAFHQKLKVYEKINTCDCKACMSVMNLTLKIVTHYGEFTSYKIKNFHHQLIGKDVITAHQLLKNDIDEHEYWLITTSLSNGNTPDCFTDWMKWETSTKKTEDGEIPFHYAQLKELKKDLNALL